MKNPQTTIAPTFLTHIISAIDGVYLDKQKNIVPKKVRHLIVHKRLTKGVIKPLFSINNLGTYRPNSILTYTLQILRAKLNNR